MKKYFLLFLFPLLAGCSSTYYSQKASGYQSAQKWEKAIENYYRAESATKDRHEIAEIDYLMGLCYVAMEEYSRALNRFLNAILWHPSDSAYDKVRYFRASYDTYYKLYELYNENGDHKEAFRYLNDAILTNALMTQNQYDTWKQFLQDSENTDKSRVEKSRGIIVFDIDNKDNGEEHDFFFEDNFIDKFARKYYLSAFSEGNVLLLPEGNYTFPLYYKKGNVQSPVMDLNTAVLAGHVYTFDTVADNQQVTISFVDITEKELGRAPDTNPSATVSQIYRFNTEKTAVASSQSKPASPATPSNSSNNTQIVDLTGQTDNEFTITAGKTYKLKFTPENRRNDGLCTHDIVLDVLPGYKSVTLYTEGTLDTIIDQHPMYVTSDILLSWGKISVDPRPQGVTSIDNISETNRNSRMYLPSIPANRKILLIISEESGNEGTYTLVVEGTR
ncbi:tetratricopeptide repeat protein [Treponema primitia]|uniref:tetratricopeptide repeat protein n=1 Tax=Treponema primitia TaxID=88058 RepID=UPI0039816D7E